MSIESYFAAEKSFVNHYQALLDNASAQNTLMRQETIGLAS